tara:strand:+ start:239 stop:388 length:150 start_codon:yes stop_codon:yes gene_type:complete
MAQIMAMGIIRDIIPPIVANNPSIALPNKKIIPKATNIIKIISINFSIL